MTELVDPSEIERIVGAKRHPTRHVGRAVSAEQTVYILHSRECRDSGVDLRECRFSLALDKGINKGLWGNHQDRPVFLDVVDHFVHGEVLAPWRFVSEQAS